MNTKFVLIFIFCTIAAPFFLISFFSQLKRIHVAALAAVLLVIFGLSRFPQGQAVLGWFGQTDHLMLPLIALVVGLAVWAILAALATRLRRSRLKWRHRPSTSDFASDCAAHLYKTGWTHRGDLRSLAADVYWVNKQKRFVTFIFCLSRLDVDTVRRAAKQIRRDFFKEVIVVSWDGPSESLTSLARLHGWRAIGIEQFKRIDVHQPAQQAEDDRSAAASGNETSWDYLRQKST